MEYVIIGNSYAALGCINGIRSVDKTSHITMITKGLTYIIGEIGQNRKGSVDIAIPIGVFRQFIESVLGE